MCIVCCISMQCTKFSSKWEHKDIKSAIKPKLVNRKTTLVSGEKFLFEERRIVTGGQPSGDHTLSCSGPSGGTRHKRQEVGWDLVLGMVSLSLSWVMIWVLPSVGCLKPRVTFHVSPCHRMRPLSHKIFVCVSCFPAVGHMQPGPSPGQAGLVCSTMGFCPVRGEQRGAPTTFCCDNFTYITSPRHTTDRWTQKTKSFIQLSLAI